MDSLVRYLASEWGVILQAPTIFTTAVLLVAVSLWGFFKWSYSNRIETLDGRLKLRDDQILDYKQKLSGATPEEARNRIDALELQVAALAPRRLTVDQRQKILDVLRPSAFLVNVTRDMGTSELRKLTQDIIDTLTVAGWTVQVSQALGIGNPPRSGVGLRVLQLGSLRPAEMLLKQALERANIPFDVQLGHFYSPPASGPHPSQNASPAADVELLITFPID